MTKAPCPYLASHDVNRRQRAPIDYPSFENSCLGTDEEDSLLLTDQATFCLSGSYRYCQRYQALVAQEDLFRSEDHDNHDYANLDIESRSPAAASTARGSYEQSRSRSQKSAIDMRNDGMAIPGIADQFDPDQFNEATRFDEDQAALSTPWPTAARRWYSWAAAGLLFFAVITMGSVFAAYTGWQLAVERLATARAGQVSTLASGPLQQVQPLYVVMTVTTEPAQQLVQTAQPALELRSGLDAKAIGTPGTDQENFPVAVTATPIILVPLPTMPAGQENNANQDAPAPVIPTDPPANIQLSAPDSTATPVPVINVQLEVPTRRATPEFDIPTSTPEALEPTPTETAVPILGTPTIVFAADEHSVPPGECTKVRWHVENVRAVYYESQAAFGDGSKEECLKDEADSYALTVIFGDGQTKIYTTTVDILWPTLTPSITPSFTPEILPTETWTPEPPTVTPTPDVVYGTTFAINGDKPYRCSAGHQCDIGVLATNTGDALDTLAIELVAAGNWPALLCSQVGTCGAQRLVIANVGPANTVFATLQVTIPADSGGQSATYALRSVSDGSNGAVTSQVIELTIESSE